MHNEALPKTIVLYVGAYGSAIFRDVVARRCRNIAYHVTPSCKSVIAPRSHIFGAPYSSSCARDVYTPQASSTHLHFDASRRQLLASPRPQDDVIMQTCSTIGSERTARLNICRRETAGQPVLLRGPDTRWW